MAAHNLQQSPFPAPFWSGGPAPGSFYNFPDNKSSRNTSEIPSSRTRHPMTSGTSVLGVKFDGGVVIAADTLGSYGSLARFRSVSRLMKVNDSTVIGATGDYADFQNVKDDIENMIIQDKAEDDGHDVSPKAIFSYLTRVMYYQRTELDPYWNVWVVGGYKDEKPFLGYVNMIGVAYESPAVATGYGSYIALPLLRDAYEKATSRGRLMTKDEAKEIILRSLKVLYYRECRTINKFELATVTEDGVDVEGPFSVETNWEIAKYVKGYDGTQAAKIA